MMRLRTTDEKISILIPQKGMTRNPLINAPETAPNTSNAYIVPIFPVDAQFFNGHYNDGRKYHAH